MNDNNDNNDKQQQIQDVVKNYIIEDTDDYIGMTNEVIERKVNELLKNLYPIFCNESTENSAFRPHYFFIFDLLDDKKVNLLYPIAMINTIQDYLMHIDDSKSDYIMKYSDEKEFQYSIDMFLAAVKYELSLRKDIVHTESDIAIINGNISAFTKDPKQYIDKIIKECQSTANELKEDINKKINEDFGKITNESIKRLNESKKYLDIANKHLLAAKNALDKDNRRINEMAKNMNNLTTNILTILGVFVSIIFIIVGAYFTVTGEIFNKSISNVFQINLGRFILMGQLLLNILFLFMFMISRLSGKSINVNCSGCKDSKCESGKCTTFRTLTKKYPYIVYSNFAIIFSYIVLFAWWIIERYVYKYLSSYLSQMASTYPISFVVVVLSVVVIILCFIIHRIKILEKKVPNTRKTGK